MEKYQEILEIDIIHKEIISSAVKLALELNITYSNNLKANSQFKKYDDLEMILCEAINFYKIKKAEGPWALKVFQSILNIFNVMYRKIKNIFS